MVTYPTLYLPNEKVESIILKMWATNNINEDVIDCCYPAMSHSIENHSSCLGVEKDVVSLLQERGHDVSDEGFIQLPESDVVSHIHS